MENVFFVWVEEICERRRGELHLHHSGAAVGEFGMKDTKGAIGLSLERLPLGGYKGFVLWCDGTTAGGLEYEDPNSQVAI